MQCAFVTISLSAIIIDYPHNNIWKQLSGYVFLKFIWVIAFLTPYWSLLIIVHSTITIFAIVATIQFRRLDSIRFLRLVLLWLPNHNSICHFAWELNSIRYGSCSRRRILETKTILFIQKSKVRVCVCEEMRLVVGWTEIGWKRYIFYSFV